MEAGTFSQISLHPVERIKIKQDESDPVRPSPPKGASHFEPIPL